MLSSAGIFGLTAERPQVYERSAFGAAIDLAVGLGVHPNSATAVKAMTRSGKSLSAFGAACWFKRDLAQRE